MTEFGSDGYLVFFGVIEKYSREFSPENGWNLVINPSYFRQKFRISSAKIKKILSKIHKWEIEYKEDKVFIFIPKFKELLDNWTSKQITKETNQLRSNDVESTQPIRLKNKEEDKDKDIIKNKPSKIQFLDTVFLLPEQHQKLIEKYGKQLTDKAIEILNNGIMSKGYKYKSHYHTLLLWPMKEAQGGTNGNRQTAGRSGNSDGSYRLPEIFKSEPQPSPEQVERNLAQAQKLIKAITGSSDKAKA